MKHISTPYGTVVPIINNFNIDDNIDFTVGFSTLEADKKQKLIHKYSDELIINISGTFKITDKSETYTITEGDCCLISKASEYTIKNVSNTTSSIIYIAFPLAPSPSQGHKYIN